MGKYLKFTILLSCLYCSLNAQQGGWRWSAQAQALYQGLTTSYALNIDGTTSSTTVNSQAGIFYGLQAAVERADTNGWIVGIGIGYLQQGLTERQETNSVDRPTDVNRERWVSHQLTLPAFLMRYLGQREVVFARLGFMPAFSVGESDKLFSGPNARSFALNANLELGVEITMGKSALRPGVLLGGSLTPVTRAGDHAAYSGIQLQWLFAK